MKILLKIKNWLINIQRCIKEVGKIYSTEESYFSKKRIESGIAFGAGQ